MWPTTRAYTDFLVRTAADGDMADLLAALLPCAWGYVVIGRALAEGSSPTTSATPTGSPSTPPTSSPRRPPGSGRAGPGGRRRHRREEAAPQEIFLLSSRYELRFWDMCWTGRAGTGAPSARELRRLRIRDSWQKAGSSRITRALTTGELPRGPKGGSRPRPPPWWRTRLRPGSGHPRPQGEEEVRQLGEGHPLQRPSRRPSATTTQRRRRSGSQPTAVRGCRARGEGRALRLLQVADPRPVPRSRAGKPARSSVRPSGSPRTTHQSPTWRESPSQVTSRGGGPRRGATRRPGGRCAPARAPARGLDAQRRFSGV
jgi:hypothetical protein